MTDDLRVILEIGKKRRVVAGAMDWPGLDRWGTSEADALEKLSSYLPRYADVADRAGLGPSFERARHLEVVERVPGSSSTDFWGIAHVPSLIEREVLSAADLERRLDLLRACWAVFDLPAVIHHVLGRAAHQELDRPAPRRFAFGVEGTDGVQVLLAMRCQAPRREDVLERGPHADLLRPLIGLVEIHVTNDLVAVAAGAAGARAEIGGRASGDVVEPGPAGLQQVEPSFQVGGWEHLALDL